MTDSTPRRGDGKPAPDIEDIEEDVADHNPDPITRRESFEQELMEESRSDEGERIDLQEDLEGDDSDEE